MSLGYVDHSRMVLQERRRALRRHLGDDAALVFAGGPRARNYQANVYPYRADSHFLYVVGVGIPHAAVLNYDRQARLFVPAEEEDDSLWHGPQLDWADLTRITGVESVHTLDELPEAIEAAGGIERVGTLPSMDPFTRYRQCSLLGLDWSGPFSPSFETLRPVDQALADIMITLRSSHDAAALMAIRRAVEVTTSAHLAGMRATRPGRKEHEVRAAMERELMAQGMVPAYNSIVTVHGEVLHNTTYDNTLGTHDLLLVDLGAEADGWATDVTRTWPVNGRFSPTQRAMYDIVLAAQADAIGTIGPGVRYRDVHLAACLTLAQGLVDEGLLRGNPQSLVERGAHAIFFPHGVGHLLGLDVHDMEDLGDRAGYARGRTRSEQFGLCYLRLDRDLEPGMIVTVEPGLYLVPAILERESLVGAFVADGTLRLDGLTRFVDVRGIRIEDDVLCTTTGPEILTSGIPKRPSDLEAMVVG